MNIAILSLYTDAHAPLNAITAPSKQRYADRWGYTFINHFGTLDESRPPSWSKILLIQKYLKDFDWIYWIDADAMIMNPAIALETYLRDYDLVISQKRSNSHFGNFQLNASSFFARNRPWTHQFVDTVYALDRFFANTSTGIRRPSGMCS
jgi:mannan polymerase II complex MNN10 subunit